MSLKENYLHFDRAQSRALKQVWCHSGRNFSPDSEFPSAQKEGEKGHISEVYFNCPFRRRSDLIPLMSK